METIREIVREQNKELLRKIADERFTDEEEKLLFIEKYTKIGYTKFKVVYDNNIIDEYNKICNRVLND